MHRLYGGLGLGLGRAIVAGDILELLSQMGEHGALHLVRGGSLRPTYPVTLRPGNTLKNIDALLPELFSLHVHLYAQRVLHGNVPPEQHAQVLALTMRSALLVEGYDTADARLLREDPLLDAPGATHVGGRDATTGSRTKDAQELATKALQLVKLTLPTRPDAAYALLGKCLKDLSKVNRLLETCLDTETGLFLRRHAAPKTFLIHPALPLLLLLTCRSRGIAVRAPQDSWSQSLPWKDAPETALCRVLSEPELPVPLSPAPPQPWLASAMADLADTLAGGSLEQSGYALWLHTIPAEAPFVLSLRHDVDRPLTKEQVQRILKFNAAHNIRSSWYFKPETYDRGMAEHLHERGQEVGYHAVHAHHGEAEKMRRELDWLSTPPGCTYHGGMGSSYTMGAITTQALYQAGFAYAERMGSWLPHPAPEGLSPVGLPLTPQSIKLESRPEWTEDHMVLIRRFRGHAIVENHPDRFDSSTEEFLEGLLRAGCVVRSVGEHVRRVMDRDKALTHWADVPETSSGTPESSSKTHIVQNSEPLWCSVSTAENVTLRYNGTTLSRTEMATLSLPPGEHLFEFIEG